MVTWERLVRREPRLAELLQQAKTPLGGCVEDIWPLTVKPQLNTLVGWFAYDQPPDLRTPDVWDVAAFTIIDAIPYCPPDCRGCD